MCVCVCVWGLTEGCYNGCGQTEGHYKIEYDQIPGIAEPVEEVKLCRLCVCVCVCVCVLLILKTNSLSILYSTGFYS